MDTARSFIEPAQVDNWLNEGQIDLAVRLKLLREEATGVTTDEFLTLPTNLSEIVSFRLGTEDDVEFVDSPRFLDYKDSAAYIEPTIARVFDDRLEMYPKPSAGTAYKLRYVRLPVAMTADAHLAEIPRELQQRLIYYAVAHAKMQENEMGQHDRFMQYYELGIPPHPLGMWKDKPGPMTLVPDDGWF